jgi:hypothetical protein
MPHVFYVPVPTHALSALSLVDVQMVSESDTTRAGSYYGLIQVSRSRYASRTLVPERFANKIPVQFLVILPAGKLASGTQYSHVSKSRGVSINPTLRSQGAGYYQPTTAPQTPAFTDLRSRATQHHPPATTTRGLRFSEPMQTALALARQCGLKEILRA